MNDMTKPGALQPFGGHAGLPVQHETAATAVAAQAKAQTEARYYMALARPRNWDQVRQDILKECRRPSFAHNKSAYYNKPIGRDGVQGLGIRFTEIGLRCMTNVMVETTTVYEDEQKEILRVTVTDLESNLTYPLDVRVTKTVERSKPMDDGSYISVRKNSYGKDVYTVPANDEDLLNKRGALISKAQRTLALRIIPGDIQDEAEEIIKAVRMDEAARDPDAERKKIADAFVSLGVKAADLQEYLGHALDTCSPSELVSLRGLYGAIRDGEATWATALENKEAGEEGRSGKGGKEPLPAYPAEQFAKKLKGWRDLIDGGKKTSDQIIAMLQTKNTLTSEQLGAIRGPAPVSGDSTIATDEAVSAMRDKAEAQAISDVEIARHLGVATFDKITVAQVDAALAFIADPVGASKKGTKK